MNKTEYAGIRFGFIIIFIWLLVLTYGVFHDKMDVGGKVNKVIILPPPVESLEPIGGYDGE